MSCGNVWWDYRSVLIPLGVCGMLLIAWVVIDVALTLTHHQVHTRWHDAAAGGYDVDDEPTPIRWDVVLLVAGVTIAAVTMALEAARVRGQTLASVALRWLRHWLGI